MPSQTTRSPGLKSWRTPVEEVETIVPSASRPRISGFGAG